MTLNTPDRNTADLGASALLAEVHEGRYARLTIGFVAAALLALLVWSAVTPVNEIATGHGVIRTRALVERVEHPDGGIVATVDASAGQHVEAGDRLLTLDTGSLDRELAKLHATRDALAAELGRVAFILEDKGVVPEFSTLDELSADELLFWAEQSYLAAQLDLIHADNRALGSTIAVLAAQKANLERELAIQNKRLARNRSVQAEGVVALSTVEGMEREVLHTERAILETRGEISARESEMDANLLREAELLANRQRDAALRRSEIEEKIINVAQSIAEIEARLARSVVTASVAGTIMEIAVSHPREVLAPGDLIAEIIPNQTIIEAEVEISADSIGAVEVGMEARLKVLSFEYTRYGEIVGEVASVSPSSFVTETGETMFRVTVALPDEGHDLSLANKPVLPGMTVSVDILSDEKKVLSYLLKPLRALGDRAFTEA